MISLPILRVTTLFSKEGSWASPTLHLVGTWGYRHREHVGNHDRPQQAFRTFLGLLRRSWSLWSWVVVMLAFMFGMWCNGASSFTVLPMCLTWGILDKASSVGWPWWTLFLMNLHVYGNPCKQKKGMRVSLPSSISWSMKVGWCIKTLILSNYGIKLTRAFLSVLLWVGWK